MSTIDSENSKQAPDAPQPKVRLKPAKKAKAGKKAPRAKKAAKPKADRTNKKAEVITMMKRGKGRDAGRDHESHGLAAAHSARLRQHPGKKGGEKIETAKNAAGERTSALSACLAFSSRLEENPASSGRLAIGSG